MAPAKNTFRALPGNFRVQEDQRDEGSSKEAASQHACAERIPSRLPASAA